MRRWASLQEGGAVRKRATKLAVTTVVVIAAGVVGPAYARLTASGTGDALTGAGGQLVVTVDAPSRSLYPGLSTEVGYTVRNRGQVRQFLGGISAQIKHDGVGIFDTNTNRFVEGCLWSWYHVAPDAQPVPIGGIGVDAGGAVHGTVELAFDDAVVSQDACQGVALEVDVVAS